MEYLLHYECPNCESDIYERCLNLIEHMGLPVFELDMNEQTMMRCQNCGWEGGTGDIEVFDFEEGEPQDADSRDDEK